LANSAAVVFEFSIQSRIFFISINRYETDIARGGRVLVRTVSYFLDGLATGFSLSPMSVTVAGSRRHSYSQL
jgi:hypothetical protein